MATIRILQTRIRGWFPREPTLNILRSTSSNNEPRNASWAPSPFLAPGALMIFAAFLSANFGLTILSLYLPDSLLVGGVAIKTGFYIGVFSVVGFVLGLVCGGILLAGKYIHVAIAGLAVIFCFGLAMIAMPILSGYEWTRTSGLFVASPMITFPVIALIQIALNSKKLKPYNITPRPELTIDTEPQPINRKPVATGLAAAGMGIIVVGLLSFVEASIWSSPMGVEILFITGVGLIVAAYVERREYKHGV